MTRYSGGFLHGVGREPNEALRRIELLILALESLEREAKQLASRAGLHESDFADRRHARRVHASASSSRKRRRAASSNDTIPIDATLALRLDSPFTEGP